MPSYDSAGGRWNFHQGSTSTTTSYLRLYITSPTEKTTIFLLAYTFSLKEASSEQDQKYTDRNNDVYRRYITSAMCAAIAAHVAITVDAFKTSSCEYSNVLEVLNASGCQDKGVFKKYTQETGQTRRVTALMQRRRR
jgi:hypothetical protein